MSENYQPNPSVQEAQPQDENCYDDILVRPHFIDRDFADVDDEYGSGIFRRYRDEYARQQIDVFAENPFNQGEPQVGLSNEENLPRLDPNEFGEGREGVSNFTDTAAAHEHSNEGQAQATLSNREQQTQSGPNEVGDGREERSNPQDGLPVNNHTNHEQPPAGLLNEEDGSPLESNEVVEDGAEVSRYVPLVKVNIDYCRSVTGREAHRLSLSPLFNSSTLSCSEPSPSILLRLR